MAEINQNGDIISPPSAFTPATIDDVGKLLWENTEGGNVEVIKSMLEEWQKDPDVINWQHPDDSNSTPLLIASGRNHAAIVRMFLDLPTAEPSINMADDNGTTPLTFAIFNGNLEIVKMLLDHPSIGKSINVANKLIGWTPLAIASSYGHSEIVKMLLKHPETIDSLNLGNHLGQTPLFIASLWCRIDVVKLLLAQPTISLSLNKADYKNQTPYSVACDGSDGTNKAEMQAMLRARGARV